MSGELPTDEETRFLSLLSSLLLHGAPFLQGHRSPNISSGPNGLVLALEMLHTSFCSP